MNVVAISEVKAKLSEYLARVRGGEEVVITDRGRAVARIVPVADRDPKIQELERRGALRVRSTELADEFFERPRPRDSGARVREALIEERREGR